MGNQKMKKRNLTISRKNLYRIITRFMLYNVIKMVLFFKKAKNILQVGATLKTDHSIGDFDGSDFNPKNDICRIYLTNASINNAVFQSIQIYLLLPLMLPYNL